MELLPYLLIYTRYSKNSNALNYGFALDASYYSSKVDSFQENNQNVVDGLSVDNQEQNGMAYKAKADISSKITDKIQMQAELNVLHMPNSDNSEVKARGIEETTWVHVKNPGIGQTLVGLNVETQYKIDEKMYVEFDAGLNKTDKASNGYNTYLSFRYKF